MAPSPLAPSPETMKHEALFKRDGAYALIVESNALLHRQASEAGVRLMQRLAPTLAERRVAKVLDLACGGQPITLARMLGSLPSQAFSYRGIDINPDQIDRIRTFPFPSNVIERSFLQGTAWELDVHDLESDYDLVFVGMNLHHGTPEEIDFLFGQIHDRLSPNGVFVNHDWFRPNTERYLRRPSSHPENPEQSFLLVPHERLLGCLSVAEETRGMTSEQPWHSRYTEALCAQMARYGADQATLASTAEHIYTRDYPISLDELLARFRSHRLIGEVHALLSGGTLSEYIFLVAASRNKISPGIDTQS